MKPIKQLINEQFRNETEMGAKLGLDDKYINAFKLWLQEHKVTTGADDGPRLYDSWLNGLIDELASDGKNKMEVKE